MPSSSTPKLKIRRHAWDQVKYSPSHQLNYSYRYMNLHGKIREGNTDSAKSAVLYRILSGMAVGERKKAGLGSAGIKWIERTR